MAVHTSDIVIDMKICDMVIKVKLYSRLILIVVLRIIVYSVA